MTIYVFQSPDGNQLEREYPMGEAPKKVQRAGVRYTRIVTGGAGFVVRGGPTSSASFTGYGLPTREKLSEDEKKHVDGWTATGHPRFDNKAHADAFCAVGRKVMERTGEGRCFGVGVQGDDAPSGKEVAAAGEKGRLIHE